MEESNLKQEGNTLNVTLSWNLRNPLSTYVKPDILIYLNNDRTSKIYNIGNVTFEMRFIYLEGTMSNQSGQNAGAKFNNIYLVRFSKSNNDNTNYSIKFVGTPDITKQFTADNDWHIVGEIDNSRAYFNVNIEITVEINVDKSRSTSFASLHDDMELTDFELRGDNGAVSIHSVVLAACSPALRAMLQRNWKETETRYLQIPDVSKATLQHLKDYMYLDKLPDTGVDKLLLVASCYLMEDLERRCSDTLINSLTASNAIELSRFALINNMTDLYIAFLKRIENGSVKVEDIEKSPK